MSSDVTPSWRALSWRTSTLTTRAGSIQSNTTLPRSGLLRTMPASFCERSLTLRDVWPAHAVLHGTSHRRTDLEQLDVGVGARKRLPQIFLELRLDEVARLYAALGHDHLLAKPCIGRLHVERQHEPRRAGADIGRPMLDRAIALQLFALEARHLRIGVGNRGVLRQDSSRSPVRHGPTRERTAAARNSCRTTRRRRLQSSRRR